MFGKAKKLSERQQDSCQEPVSVVNTPVEPVSRMTLTVEETADELNISRPMAYKLVKEPSFPSFRIGERILVSRRGLQWWIDKMSAGPIPGMTDTAA